MFAHLGSFGGVSFRAIPGSFFGTMFSTLRSGELPQGVDKDLWSGGPRPEAPNTKESSTDRPSERSLWRRQCQKIWCFAVWHWNFTHVHVHYKNGGFSGVSASLRESNVFGETWKSKGSAVYHAMWTHPDIPPWYGWQFCLIPNRLQPTAKASWGDWMRQIWMVEYITYWHGHVCRWDVGHDMKR